MALINLLPWREEHRQEKKKEFLGILVGVLLVAGVCAAVWLWVVEDRIDVQEGRNQLLTQGIQVLDRELKEIKDLKQKRKLWLERMEVIQGLQLNRAEVVKVFDEFARAIPDGVFVTNLVRNGGQLSLTGFAESTLRVSALMRQLDASAKFTAPNLKKTQADDTLGEQGYRFELSVKLVKPATLTEGQSVKEG